MPARASACAWYGPRPPVCIPGAVYGHTAIESVTLRRIRGAYWPSATAP